MARYSSSKDGEEKAKALQEPESNPLLSRYKLEVERRLSEIYSSDGWISAAANEAITAGKRLRPIVAVLACEAICGNPEPAFPVAMAYELAHSASLIQDDIIDESAMRHAGPTAYKRYGLARAIMLSDSLIFEIFTLLARYEGTQVSKEGLVKLLESSLGRAASLAAEGEMLEVALSRRGDIKEEEYSKVIGHKTGALFAASAASGAVVAGADKALVDRMYEFGLALGCAFQIGDDILDMTGNAETTGKPVFKDIENNAGNVVLLHALSKVDPTQKNTINSLLFKKWFTSIEAEKLLDLLNELGSFEYASSLLNKQTALCRSLLETLPPSHARSALEELTRTVEVRDG